MGHAYPRGQGGDPAGPAAFHVCGQATCGRLSAEVKDIRSVSNTISNTISDKKKTFVVLTRPWMFCSDYYSTGSIFLLVLVFLYDIYSNPHSVVLMF